MQSETGIDWHVSGGEDVQTNKTISMSSMEAGKWMYSLLTNYFKKKPHKRDLKKIVFLIEILVLA